MFSRAHGTASSTTTTTTTTTYRTLASRSAAAAIINSSTSTSTSTSTSNANSNSNSNNSNNNSPAHPHSFLTGIAEHTFTEPATSKPSSPAPARPSLRSVSVTSFLSDGTVEIEGFGFDEISEYGGGGGGGDDDDHDDDDNNSSIFGAESLYDDSVFGDEHEAGTGSSGGGGAEPAAAGGGGGGSGSGSGGDADLSRRAEKILANAKRKLDLCGRNISRARSSLILSPSATPTALLDHLDAVGPAVVRRRAESAGGSHSQQWGGYNNRLGRDDRTAAAVAQAAHHTRTASESALHFSHSARGLGLAARFGGSGGSIDMGVLAEDPHETAEKQQQHHQQGEDEQQHMHGVANRSNSTQQMRALRDQMKDLRGKITSLQEQTKSDSVRRRQSISSMRSHDSPPASSTALEGIRESRVLDIASPIEHEWQHVATQQRISADSVSVYSDDRCGTPTASSSSPSSALPPPPPAPRREDVNSPTSSPGSNAFSYDNYLIGGSFIKRIRPTSISSDGTASTATATLPAPPPHTIQRKGSFVSISSYATADETPDVSPSQSPDPDSNSPPPRAPRRVESTLLLPGLRPPSDLGLPPPKQWAVSSSLRVDDGYHSAPHTPRVDKDLTPPPPPPPSAPAARLPVLPASSWYRDSVDTVRTRSMLFEGAPSATAIGGGGGIGGGGVAISSSTRDSHTMVVGGMGGVGGVGGEIELRIAKGDRQLIEAVIEALGRVCCSMETAGEPLRAELRERLRGAMKVLEGEDPEGEMF